MVLEVAMLDVKSGQTAAFEQAFGQAQKIIGSMQGYINHQLHRCIEDSHRYVLTVNWQTLEHHTEGFRQSEQYLEWKALLHHFYSPFPTVEHFTQVY